MDGRTLFLRGVMGLGVVAGGILFQATVFGQAMGTVTLDGGAGGPGGATSAPALQITLSPPPTVVAPVGVAEAKTAVPLPVGPTTVPGGAVEATGPAAPLVSVVTGEKSEAAVKAAPEKAQTDSMPVDATKATAAIRPIEHEEIHPRVSGGAVGGAPAEAPAVKSMLPSGMSSLLQVFTAMTVVIGLIFLGKALAKKYLPAAKVASGKGVIEVLARYPLSKNQSLVLVRIGSQIVTLNQGKDQSQSVLVINDPNEVAKILGQIEGTSPKSIQAGFNRLLSNARMDLEDPANNPEREDFETRSMEPENLDSQLEEMAAAKRQLMELRQQVRSVRDSLPR